MIELQVGSNDGHLIETEIGNHYGSWVNIEVGWDNRNNDGYIMIVPCYY